MEELGWFRKIMWSSYLEEGKAPESDCFEVYIEDCSSISLAKK